MFSITTIIIVITCLISFVAFNDQKIAYILIFHPPDIAYRRQYYRFFTCGFIHADFMHLFFNMYSFWVFGQLVEKEFIWLFNSNGKWLYLLMYISALFFCLLPTYVKNRTNENYYSLGASGAISAVVFAFIFLNPLIGVGLAFVPGIYIPGFIFGALYLVISSFLGRRKSGRINHSAHIWGALYGIAFVIIAAFMLLHNNAVQHFIEQVKTKF